MFSKQNRVVSNKFSGKVRLSWCFSVLRRIVGGSVSAAVPLASYPGLRWRLRYGATVPSALVASSTSEQEVHSALEQVACVSGQST